MSDPERIWLQNADDARATGDRLWCQDKVWPECEEQQEPTEYIRADLYASRLSQQDAELERMRREVEDMESGLAGSTGIRTVVGGEYSVQIHFADLAAMQAYLRCIRSICADLRAKAEETTR